MKCPYTIGITKQVTQRTYNEQGYEEQFALLETKEFISCFKEQCGAWQGGKCNYKGAID